VAISQLKEDAKEQVAKITKRPEFLVLANQNLKEALALKDDPVKQVAILMFAGELALNGGDVDLAMRSCDEIDQRFATNGLVMKTGMLGNCEAVDHISQAVLADRAYRLLDRSLEESNFRAAEDLLGIADRAANLAKNPKLVAQVRSRAKEIGEIAKEFDAVRP